MKHKKRVKTCSSIKKSDGCPEHSLLIDDVGKYSSRDYPFSGVKWSVLWNAYVSPETGQDSRYRDSIIFMHQLELPWHR